jgi:hypothetical protein
MARGENLESIQGRTEDLQSSAAKFQAQGTQLRRRMWYAGARLGRRVVRRGAAPPQPRRVGCPAAAA